MMYVLQAAIVAIVSGWLLLENVTQSPPWAMVYGVAIAYLSTRLLLWAKQLFVRLLGRPF